MRQKKNESPVSEYQMCGTTITINHNIFMNAGNLKSTEKKEANIRYFIEKIVGSAHLESENNTIKCFTI